jgi:hypothetical protein
MTRQKDAAIDVGVLEYRFWQMTPAELAERVEIARRREDRERERAAWMTHYIMAAFMGDKAPSIDRLRGRETDA